MQHYAVFWDFLLSAKDKLKEFHFTVGNTISQIKNPAPYVSTILQFMGYERKMLLPNLATVFRVQEN